VFLFAQNENILAKTLFNVKKVMSFTNKLVIALTVKTCLPHSSCLEYKIFIAKHEKLYLEETKKHMDERY
jgi:hypothetical protein